jgi:hypothetical protein
VQRYLGEFEVDSVIDRLRLGSVLSARRRTDGERVHLWTLQPNTRLDDAENAHARRMFDRRRHAAARLGEYARFPEVVASGCDDGITYYATRQPTGEPIPFYFRTIPSPGAEANVGESASTPFPEGQRISTWLVRSWLIDLCSAVDHAQRSGMVIGNISAHTVWVCTEGNATIVDPGDGGERSPLLQSVCRDAESPMGDPGAYLAPEQILGRDVGPAADVYALGTLLFWLLGGAFPASRRRDAARIDRFLPLPPLSGRVNAGLAAVCRKATALSPQHRYKNADLMRSELLFSADDPTAPAGGAANGVRSTLIHGFSPTPAPAARSRVRRWLNSFLDVE